MGETHFTASANHLTATVRFTVIIDRWTISLLNPVPITTEYLTIRSTVHTATATGMHRLRPGTAPPPPNPLSEHHQSSKI